MKRLVIAPHVDDDVIGCGGILDADTLVYYCGVDAFHEVSAQERFDEAAAVSLATGHDFIWPTGNRCVNRYDVASLISDFERVIGEHSLDEVLLPWPSYNQDHRAVYDAAMVALRPHDRNQFIPRVLLYEEPDCFWPGMREPFTPTLFRPIDIERKLHLYSLMKSQVRGMRSPEHLRALARVRGAACNEEYAEAYHILRWVE